MDDHEPLWLTLNHEPCGFFDYFKPQMKVIALVPRPRGSGAITFI